MSYEFNPDFIDKVRTLSPKKKKRRKRNKIPKGRRLQPKNSNFVSPHQPITNIIKQNHGLIMDDNLSDILGYSQPETVEKMKPSSIMIRLSDDELDLASDIIVSNNQQIYLLTNKCPYCGDHLFLKSGIAHLSKHFSNFKKCIFFKNCSDNFMNFESYFRHYHFQCWMEKNLSFKLVLIDEKNANVTNVNNKKKSGGKGLVLNNGKNENVTNVNNKNKSGGKGLV